MMDCRNETVGSVGGSEVSGGGRRRRPRRN